MSSKKFKSRKQEESDDDAPEAVSNTSAKSSVLDEKHKQRLNKLQIEDEKKQKKASAKSTPEKSVEVPQSKQSPSSSKKKDKLTQGAETPSKGNSNENKVKGSNPNTPKTPKDKKEVESPSNKKQKDDANKNKNKNNNEKQKEAQNEAVPLTKNAEKKSKVQADEDAMEVDNKEAEPTPNPKEKSKKDKKLAPLPMEVLQKLAQDQSIKKQVESSRSARKRSREEREAEVQEPLEEGSDLDDAALENIRLPSDDDLEEVIDGEDGEPATKKAKTYGMFNVVALDTLKDGNDIDAKVKQFLRGHFWGDRIPRSDPNKYFSERIQYGPAINFADDDEVDSLEDLINDEDGVGVF